MDSILSQWVEVSYKGENLHIKVIEPELFDNAKKILHMEYDSYTWLVNYYGKVFTLEYPDGKIHSCDHGSWLFTM